MYDNKILVNIHVLSLGRNCEIFIPINEKVGNIIKLLGSVITDSIDFTKNSILMNADSGKCYDYNLLVRDIDIRNGSKLILI